MTDTLALPFVEILILVALSDLAGANTPTQLVAESIVLRALLDVLALANTSTVLVAVGVVRRAFLDVFASTDARARLDVEVVVWSTFLDDASSDALASCPAPVIMWRSTFIVVWANADAFA